MGTERAPWGVAFLDHTADVGVAVTAPTLPELLVRAARGMDWLVRGLDRFAEAQDEGGRRPGPQGGDVPGGREVEPREERHLTLTADDLPALLRSWLRELLHWHEAEGLAFRDARFHTLSHTRLDGVVTLTPDRIQPVREIKGVTLHGLVAEEGGEGWVGQVIFDV